MGSSLLTSGLSPEEQKEADRAAQEEWDKTHEVMAIKGGEHNTSRVPGGGQVETYTLKNGRKGFTGDDGTVYYYNEANGRWESSTGARNYYNLGPLAAPAPAPSGGGEAPKQSQPTLLSGVTGDVGAVETPGVTTEQVLGTQNYESMNNFVPTSHTMGNPTQTQHLNPLVDPGNWLYQLQPQPTYNLGTYINPGVGLLENEQQNSIWGIV